VLPNKSATEWCNKLKPTDEPSLAATPVDLKGALAEAFANSPELSRLRVQQDINKIDKQFFRNQTLPRVDLQATIFTYGLAGSLVGGSPAADLVGGYGQALRNLA